MKLLFDTSVWVEHLRRDVLTAVVPAVRGRFLLWFDAVSASELRAGCRNKRERQTVTSLLLPFEKAGRIETPLAGDYVRAAAAISLLRERGKTLKRPSGALLDGLIAAVGVRLGALIVTVNVGDFAVLATALPVRVESMTDFMKRL